MNSDGTHRIRERAYQIWIREGQPEGREFENWHQAERELAEEGARAEHEHDEAGPAAAREYGRDAKEVSESGKVDRSARETSDSLSGPDAEKLKKAEAAGKSRSKAKNSSGNI
jgi:hypothetical protein